jgi:hypothetical protein
MHIHDYIISDVVGHAGVLLCACGLLCGGYWEMTEMQKRFGRLSMSWAAENTRGGGGGTKWWWAEAGREGGGRGVGSASRGRHAAAGYRSAGEKKGNMKREIINNYK